MALILGFDPSKTSGYALFDTERDFAAISCGVLEMPDKADEYFTADQIGLKVRSLITEIKEKHGQKPDFAVLEQQIMAQVKNDKGQNFSGSIYPWIATSAIVSTLANFAIPYGTLMPASWRKSFFGQGYKPEKDAKGKADWKTAAIRECERLGIQLPRTKAHADDAAEACAVAICWASRDMNLHAGRYHEPWMKLVQARGEKAKAA